MTQTGGKRQRAPCAPDSFLKIAGSRRSAGSLLAGPGPGLWAIGSLRSGALPAPGRVRRLTGGRGPARSLPAVLLCSLPGRVKEEDESQGGGRCQQALGTASSWPRDLGTQTWPSNQGSGSLARQGHDPEPRGRRKRDQKKGILQAQPQPAPVPSRAGAGLGDKPRAVEQSGSLSGAGRPLGSRRPAPLASLLLPLCLDGGLRPSTPTPGPALWLHLGPPQGSGEKILEKTNAGHRKQPSLCSQSRIPAAFGDQEVPQLRTQV